MNNEQRRQGYWPVVAVKTKNEQTNPQTNKTGRPGMGKSKHAQGNRRDDKEPAAAAGDLAQGRNGDESTPRAAVGWRAHAELLTLI